jgi:hypothetical protein
MPADGAAWAPQMSRVSPLDALRTYTLCMTSIEVADATAAFLRSQAARAGVSVDAYIRRLAVVESLQRHDEVLDEQFYADADAERLAG